MARLAIVLFAIAMAQPVRAQRRSPIDRYDDVFRKWSKRYFGPGFDWRIFKAQGMTESNVEPDAKSPVGARGVMQLMPSTFSEIASRNPQMKRVDDPQWNIAAGIYYDRALWRTWQRDSTDLRRMDFTFGSYNAGLESIRKAQSVAASERLDRRQWPSIESVAPKVSRWRYRETLDYVRRIEQNLARLDDKGRVIRRPFRAIP